MPTDETTTLQPLLAAITIMGSGRLGPTLTALIGLLGAALGVSALTRAHRRGRADPDIGPASGRSGATVALVLGTISVLLGGLFLATADGGPGTGNGVVASVAALALGPIAMALGGIARARYGRELVPPADGIHT